jgi:tetratricopeptide (TPR) repeat protein
MYAIGFSHTLQKEGLTDSALVIIRHAYELAKKENIEYWIAKTLMQMGTVYFYKTAYQTTLTHFLEALPVLEKSDDKASLTKLYDNIGSVYRVTGSLAKPLNIQKKRSTCWVMKRRHSRELFCII